MAKRFRFRLERILQYRKVIKEEKKRDLMLKNAALKEAEQRLEALERSLRESTIEETGELPVDRLHLKEEYEKGLRIRIEKQIERVAELSLLVEEAYREYVEASKDLEALRILKRRRYEEYIEELNKEEAKFLDELSVQRYKRSEDLVD